MSRVDLILASLREEIRADILPEVRAEVRAELRREIDDELARLGKRYVRIEELCRKLDCSRDTFDRLRDDPRKGFPKPRKGVDKSPRWIMSEVEDWMDRFS